MFTAALTTIKKFFGVSTDVRETTKRPLEEESENECEESTIFHACEPQRKKRCSRVDQPPSPPSDNTPSRFSPVLMRLPWFSWKKEEDSLPDIKMSSARSRPQKEKRHDAEVTVVEERVKKWSVPTPNATALYASGSQQEDEVEVLEGRGAKSVSELATRRPPLAHSAMADFRFAPSSAQRPVEHDFSVNHSNMDYNSLRSPRSHKSVPSKNKSDFKGYPGSILDRLLGKRRSTGVLSSRIKHWGVQKSFLHEEKMKYRQLLQQYTKHYLTPNAKAVPHTASSSPVGMVTRSQWPPLWTKQKQEHIENSSSVSSSLRLLPPADNSGSPVGMVTRSQWPPLWTKQKQEHIENASSVSSSLRLLPSADNSRIEDVLGSRKIVDLEESQGRCEKQKSDSFRVPLIDLSKDDNEEQNTSDKESDDESVVVVKEVLSPQAHKNSLEERLQEHPLYDLNWIKSLRKEYEDRAHNAKKDADIRSKHIQELEQRRSKKVSLDEKVTQRLKLLDLTYPSKYTEIPDEEEEEEAFVPLTPEMENEIDRALNGRPESEVLIEKFHIQITRRDVRTLDRLNWLNDEVINFYMNLIMERSQKNDNYPRVYAFNTFFYPKLSKSGYQSVRRWTKKVDLFGHDMLLVPVHLGMHWCMSVVDMKTKCISYYDSMLGSNDWCLQSLLEYLEAEHQDKKSSPYSTSMWKLENKKDIPQQMNGSDCGMFACKFAEYLSRRAKINFDQQHMPYFRRRMVYEITTAKLL